MFAPVTREWEVSMEGKSVILSPTSSQSLQFLKVGADGGARLVLGSGEVLSSVQAYFGVERDRRKGV